MNYGAAYTSAALEAAVSPVAPKKWRHGEDVQEGWPSFGARPVTCVPGPLVVLTPFRGEPRLSS
jgi:hypothetical protein